MATTCPECGSRSIAKIVYGMPGPEMMEASQRGEVALGGCCLVVDETGESAMPERSCRDCGHSFTTPSRRRPALT